QPLQPWLQRSLATAPPSGSRPLPRSATAARLEGGAMAGPWGESTAAAPQQRPLPETTAPSTPWLTQPPWPTQPPGDVFPHSPASRNSFTAATLPRGSNEVTPPATAPAATVRAATQPKFVFQPGLKP
ncbi:MAG: hypothetical protein KDA45_16595, partial [Planctomycetales bacterium]|nr:hypothetical protein [Planctomycetales bacterium]